MGNRASPDKHCCLPPSGPEGLPALLKEGKPSSPAIANLRLPLAGQCENLEKCLLCKGSILAMLLRLKVKSDSSLPPLANSRVPLLTTEGSCER